MLLAWHTNEHLVNTSREFWHLFFTFFCWNWTFAKTQESGRFENKVCPCLVLLAWHTNEHLVNTSREFWHLFLPSFAGIGLLPKLRKACGLKTRSVPFLSPFNKNEVCPYFNKNKVCTWLVLLAWRTNEHLVNTSREFWHLFFAFFCWNWTFAKTQESVRFENKVCPSFMTP